MWHGDAYAFKGTLMKPGTDRLGTRLRKPAWMSQSSSLLHPPEVGPSGPTIAPTPSCMPSRLATGDAEPPAANTQHPKPSTGIIRAAHTPVRLVAI